MDREASRRSFIGMVGAAAVGGLGGCQAPGSFLPTESGETTTQGETDVETLNGLSSVDPSPQIGSQGTPTGAHATVYEEVAPSVCTVRVYTGGAGSAQGSAFAYGDRTLVTNEHVVSDAESVFVRFQNTGWGNAEVVATDVYSDLAVLSVDDLPDTATGLPFVDDEPPIGTQVVAIGNPFGYTGSMSSGIISGVDRTLPAANGFSIPDAVQTDAPVNPGNSGGPLVTLDGNVVGVINSGGGDNIGFGISAALVKPIVPDLIATGSYDHSYMGVKLQSVTPTVARANDIDGARGVYIDDPVDDGPADGVLQGSTSTTRIDGIQTPVGGDVVVSLDGTSIPGRQSLGAFLALETQPGDTIDVGILRDGTEQTVQLTLGTRPDPNTSPA